MREAMAQELRERELNEADSDAARVAHVAEQLPLLLRQASQAVDAALLSTVRDGGLVDLSLSALHVLRLVGARGRSIGALARDLGVSPQAASKTIAVLEAKGLVSKEPHPRDGSALVVALDVLAAPARRRPRWDAP